MKAPAVCGGELGQATQLGKRVGQVVAVRVDNGDPNVLALDERKKREAGGYRF